MNVIGTILFTFFGLLCFKYAKIIKYDNNKDYTKYNVTMATIRRVEFNRRMVEFVDEYGNTQLALDDYFTKATFKPEKQTLLKLGTKKEIYYWDIPSQKGFYLDGKKINYIFHFCDEDLYAFIRKRKKINVLQVQLIGILCFIFGITIYFFG